MNKSSTQTKESYKESELLLGEHEQIKLPKQRILQKGGGNIKGTGIKSSTQAFPKSWEAYHQIRREREGTLHFHFALVGCKWGKWMIEKKKG